MGKFLGGDKSLSRQRRWQLRKVANGLCHICGKKAVMSMLCLKHAVVQRETRRKKMGYMKRRKRCKTYQLQKKKVS